MLYNVPAMSKFDLKTIREQFDLQGKRYPKAADIYHTSETIAGVDCHWYGKQNLDYNEILVYVHGGGFFLGSNRTHGPWASHLAHQIGKSVLLIDYSLAPENPFPIALDEVLRVITSLQERYPSAKIGLLGDSAGGNIALSSGISLRDSYRKQPAYYIFISPWLDLECKSSAFERNQALDLDLTRDGLQECARMYANGKSLQEPLISPLYANFAKLSPTLIMCGTHEILEDDSQILYQRLQAENIRVTFEQFKDQGHSWSFYDVNCPASLRALALIKEFVHSSST
jgi:acetyl esterase/lipase